MTRPVVAPTSVPAATLRTALYRASGFVLWPLATDRIFMADGRFGCEAHMAGSAARLDQVARPGCVKKDPERTSDVRSHSSGLDGRGNYGDLRLELSA
jgi:hypothetical protein